MTLEHKKETAPSPSVGADGEQSLAKHCNHSIAENICDDNDLLQQFKKRDEMAHPNYIYVRTATELLDQSIQPQKSVIDGLLYAGTYILAGAPKVGKSFLSVELCHHVAKGIPLWGMPVQQGTALYLALEDDDSRLQRRFSTMFGVRDMDKLYFATQAKLLGVGLEEQLRYFVRNHPDTRLIVIDTLQKIRGAEQMSYANDYDVVAKFKAISDSLGICILLVHHTRKQGADDHFDTISGTNGILGAADGGLVLYKEKRVSENAVLMVTGRDQPESAITLKRNPQTQAWENCTELAPVDTTPPYEILPIVADFLDSLGGAWSGRASELLELLGNVNMPVNLFTRQLNVGNSWLYRYRDLYYDSARTNQGSKLTFAPISTKS